MLPPPKWYNIKTKHHSTPGSEDQPGAGAWISRVPSLLSPRHLPSRWRRWPAVLLFPPPPSHSLHLTENDCGDSLGRKTAQNKGSSFLHQKCQVGDGVTGQLPCPCPFGIWVGSFCGSSREWKGRGGRRSVCFQKPLLLQYYSSLRLTFYWRANGHTPAKGLGSADPLSSPPPPIDGQHELPHCARLPRRKK